MDDFGQTIVMVTHDASAATYADRVLFLADGRIVGDLLAPTMQSVLDRSMDTALSGLVAGPTAGLDVSVRGTVLDPAAGTEVRNSGAPSLGFAFSVDDPDFTLVAGRGPLRAAGGRGRERDAGQVRARDRRHHSGGDR